MPFTACSLAVDQPNETGGIPQMHSLLLGHRFSAQRSASDGLDFQKTEDRRIEVLQDYCCSFPSTQVLWTSVRHELAICWIHYAPKLFPDVLFRRAGLGDVHHR